MYRILAVNPGSTSTKISVSDDENLIFEATINHSREELKKYKRISDQYEMRKDLVIAEVKKHGLPVQFDAIIGPGGLAKPVKSGVFRVNDQMVEDQRKALHQHACDQGCIIAHEIAEEIGMGGSGQLKKYVTQAVNEYFAPIRERRQRYENDLDYVKGVLHEGNRRANEIADQTLAEVQDAMGMVY